MTELAPGTSLGIVNKSDGSFAVGIPIAWGDDGDRDPTAGRARLPVIVSPAPVVLASIDGRSWARSHEDRVARSLRAVEAISDAVLDSDEDEVVEHRLSLWCLQCRVMIGALTMVSGVVLLLVSLALNSKPRAERVVSGWVSILALGMIPVGTLLWAMTGTSIAPARRRLDDAVSRYTRHVRQRRRSEEQLIGVLI